MIGRQVTPWAACLLSFSQTAHTMTVLARSVQRLQTKSPVPALPPAGCVTLGQSLYCLNENVLICKSGVLSPPLQHHMGVLVINVASEPLFVFLGGEFLMELLGLLLLLLLQQLSAAPAPAAGSAEMGLPAPLAKAALSSGGTRLPSADQHLPPPPLPPARQGWAGRPLGPAPPPWPLLASASWTLPACSFCAQQPPLF